MITPKPPMSMLVDQFEYFEYEGDGNWGQPSFKDGVVVRYCRIDRGSQYSTVSNGKQLLYNALILCYADLTEPFEQFKVQSKVVFDGVEHIVTNVVYVTDIYSKELYSIELEVI